MSSKNPRRAEARSPEVRYYVPFPAVILLGCGAFRPYDPADPRKPWPRGECPACKGRVGTRPATGRDGLVFNGWALGGLVPIYAAYQVSDGLVYCAWCDSLSPANEANVAKQLEEARKDERAKAIAEAEAERTRRAEDAARRTLEQRAKEPDRIKFSESERRAIWLGRDVGPRNPSPRSVREDDLEPTNRAAIGRKFLAEIGQEPDWNLILDSRGRPVGRWVLRIDAAGEERYEAVPNVPGRDLEKLLA